MTVPRYDFTVVKGDTGTLDHWTGLVVVLKADDQSPWDLTGAQVTFEARWNDDGAFMLSSDASEIEIDLASGQITVPIDETTFDAVPDLIQARYALRLTQPPYARTLLAGQIKVEQL